MKRLRNWLFAFFFALPVILFWVNMAVNGQQTVSETENRALVQMPVLSAQSFRNGVFQDELEEAIGDQLPGSEMIRSAVKDTEAGLLDAMQNAFSVVFPEMRNGYLQISDGYYTYRGDEHRIVERPLPFEKTELLERMRDALQAQPAPVYLYFVENSRSLDFDHPTCESEWFLRLREELQPTAARNFTFADYDGFCSLFYETDHHWNAEGSYRGYTEILEMIRPGETPLAKGELIEIPAVFNGSYARLTKRMCAAETFAFYDFDIPKHTETMNGKRGTYGRLNAYRKGKYTADTLTNHYAACYGGDYGEIIYDFGTEGKGNLLMIASSYSNPINGLIASHFDRTYVIDLRYYEEWAGKPFDPAAYVRGNDIGTVLLLGDAKLFADEGEGE